MANYRVVLAPSVVETLRTIGSKEDARRVKNRLLSLSVAPHFGAAYDPIYDAARPDHEVLVTYACHYGIYYVFDDAEKLVNVEYLEDTRHDSMSRFSG